MTEAFLERHNCAPDGQVIVQYKDVWVMLGHKPCVYWKSIECESPELVEISTQLLKDRKTIAEVYNINVLKLKIDTTTPRMDQLLAEIRQDSLSDVETLVGETGCPQIHVIFGDTKVVLGNNNFFKMKWKTVQSEEMKERAIDVLRYPGLIRHIHLRHVQVINTVDMKGNDIAKAIEDQFRDQRISSFLNRHNRTEIRFIYDGGIHVDLSMNKCSLTHNNMEYSNHPIMDDAIERLEFPLDVDDQPDTLQHIVHAKNLSIAMKMKLDALSRSTATFQTYTVHEAHREKMINVLMDYDKFSIHNSTFGVGFNNSDEKDEFEGKYALEINLHKEIVTMFAGGDTCLDILTAHNKITFIALEGAVYYVKLQHLDANKTRISISGESSTRHPAIQADYFKNNKHIYIYDF